MSASNKQLPHIAITAGEPAGIGPDLCVALAQQAFPAHITIIADQTLINSRAKQLNQNISTVEGYASEPHNGLGKVFVKHIPTNQPVVTGQLSPNNSQYVLNTLDEAITQCNANQIDAIVTAPVHKGVINDAGIPFTGHTEYLAEKTNTEEVVMMLVGGEMRVALATTHLPLTAVSNAITKNSLTKTIRILHQDLIQRFGIQNPHIMVAGLNPHAGENGYLGDEEINVINPVLADLRKEGMQLTGAMPADTMFSKSNIPNCDAFLAMYHDQGLPVLKHASFGEGVNVTLGLPIIRTSVDHGTALDIAGSGQANIGSLCSAIELAISLARNKYN